MSDKSSPGAAGPPVARTIPHSAELHGERREDPYFWLREKANPEVAAYLEAENAYADAVMAPTRDSQEQLYRKMLSHLKETDVEVPYRKGDWFYYSRTEAGRQYTVHCRKRGSLEAEEEVVLDLNALAEGHPYLGLGVFEVSDDGHRFAYSIDTTGFRRYTLQVKDLRTGEALPDRREGVGSAAWAADNRTLFYTVEDAAKRQYRLYRHRLGEQEDELLYEEADERFRVGVARSRSRACLFLTSRSHTSSEVRTLAEDLPGAGWRLIAPRKAGEEYYADHHGDRFFIRTNDRGRNFRLVSAPAAAPDRANWTERVPHRPEVMLEGVELFAGHCVLRERAAGLPVLRILDLQSGGERQVTFPEPAYALFPAENREWETDRFRYRYESLVTPASVFDCDMRTAASTLLKRKEIPGGFDPARYRSERLAARAPDGTEVPVSVVHRRDSPPDGSRPLLLIGYGSYGFALPATFDANRLCLLDHGVTIALAHVRGGGEMGKAWHEAGRMLNKRNTFSDFIAVAEHLLARGYAARGRLAIQGGSAGGLLMGAVTNMRPELFRAVLSYVPFVDAINTMADASLPLTVGEFEEWGNPAVKAEYEYMKSYCPYTNLRAGNFPAMLVRTAFNDSQVMYWEPAKYVARLRTLKRDPDPLLLKTHMGAGHGGASGRYDSLRDKAFDYAFLLTELGVEPSGDGKAGR